MNSWLTHEHRLIDLPFGHVARGGGADKLSRKNYGERKRGCEKAYLGSRV
jgi:hypothetical protein